jgi:translocation and assembly module TamB
MNMEAALDQEKGDTTIDGKVRFRKLVYPSFSVESLALDIQGTLARQKIVLFGQGSPGQVTAILEGGYVEKQWQGNLISLLGTSAQGGGFSLQSPVSLQISPERFRLSPSVLIGSGEERLTLAADLDLKTMTGSTSLDWQQVDLSRIGLFEGKVLSGRSSGQAEVKWLGPERLHLQAWTDLKGTWLLQDKVIKITRAGLSARWDDSGLRASWNGETPDQARIWGQATSAEKGQPTFPRQLSFNVRWDGLDVNLIPAKTHPAFQTQGKCLGQAEGVWSSKAGFRIKGGLKIAGGSLIWKDQETLLKALIKTAETGIDWRDNQLQGNLILDLEGHGKITGNFRLPLLNQFPVTMERKGPLEAHLQGDIRERGLLAALLPEAVLSGQGRLKWNVAAKGTWENPILNGGLELSEPAAEIKPLGILIRDITLKGTFSQSGITITSLSMASGKGRLSGTAHFRLKDWQVAQLNGKINGDHFQFINRPGLEAQAGPALEFSGTPNQLVVAGVLEIQEGLISGNQPEGFKRTSPDVRLVDRPVSSPKEKVLPIQGEIDLVMGKEVRLKAEGLEGFLQGTVRVRLKSTKDLKAFGEIRIIKGTYLLQGQSLRLTHGRFLFNGPPDNPVLDLLALRTIRSRQRLEDWVDEVKAGIAVTGALQKPLIKLYSQPPLSDTDILSYILFGEALNQGTGSKELVLLGKAAKTLLGAGLKDKVPGVLSPDTIEVQSDNSDISHSVVTVGKYIDPRLFLGLGGSLFNNSYQVILRYSLTRHLEVETKGGTSSGGNIYFKVYFE